MPDAALSMSASMPLPLRHQMSSLSRVWSVHRSSLRYWAALSAISSKLHRHDCTGVCHLGHSCVVHRDRRIKSILCSSFEVKMLSNSDLKRKKQQLGLPSLPVFLLPLWFLRAACGSHFPVLVASKRKLSGENQDRLKMLSVGGWKEWMCDVSEWRS